MRVLPILSIALMFAAACTQGPKHPQASLINQNSATAITEQSILLLADSIDKEDANMEKRTSLVYQMGDMSMYAEQYSTNGKTIMLAEYTNNAGINNSTKKFYFKNDSLVYVKENNTNLKDGKNNYENVRTFLRNNIPFKKEARASNSLSVLNSESFQALKPAEIKNTNFTEAIATINDAINGTNMFDLVFDDIIKMPNETRIVLKAKSPGLYNSNIIVKETDNYIDSILKDPLLFKEQKLNLRWRVADKEAIYVPVDAGKTSAKGLKR
jgi:hypothetical protein